jgi:hypothetical protein
MAEDDRDAAGHFQPGNPGRRPGAKGKRPAMLRALDNLAASQAEDIIRTVAKAATEGDMRAAEILLRRIWPEPKGRPVSVALPALRQPGDLANAAAEVIAAVARGELSPDEGQSVAALLETQRRAIETVAFEERLAAIERHIKEGK